MHHRTRTITRLAAGLAVFTGGSLMAAAPAQAGQIAATVQIQGAGKVVVIEGTLDSGNPVCDRSSNQDERVTVTCPSVRAEELFEAWLWLRPTPAAFPGGHWQFDRWEGCHQTRVRDGFAECAVKSGAFTGDSATPKAIFRDVHAPTVSSIQSYGSQSYERTFHYSFSTNEGVMQCQTDGGPWEACASGAIRAYATEGWHSFKVRAVDPSGQVSQPQQKDDLVVDTAMSHGPGGLVASSSANFTLTSGAGNAYRCSLDGGLYEDCAGVNGLVTFHGLSQGQHTLRAYAVNNHWLDHVPYQRTWTVDSVAPQTTLTGKSLSGRDAAFAYSSSEPGTFQCRLRTGGDGPGWDVCGPTYTRTGLVDGSYTFEVRARDHAGNVDATPASHSFVIDRSAPETTFTSGPAEGSFVLSDSATLRASSSEHGSTIACSLDGVGTACPDGFMTLTGLTRATHVATARATDPAGNADALPASRTWTVPLDNTDLGHDRWVRRSATGAYLGTYSQATRKGATLSRKVTGARKVALVVTKGKGHGKVTVFAGSRRLRTIDLAAAKLQRKRLIPVSTFATPYTGTLRVKVATAGKVVRVEGLGVATQ